MEEIAAFAFVNGPNEYLEKVAFAKWINYCLADDKITERHIPILLGNDDLFEKISDGLILIQLVNHHFPKSIHTKAIFHDAIITRKERISNITLAFITATCYGCSLEAVNVFQIFSGVKSIILEMIWQILRVGFSYEINLINQHELLVLKKSNETILDLRENSSSEIVIRYINYQLSRAGGAGSVTSFFDNFSDGSVYYALATLLFPNSTNQSGSQSAPRDKRGPLKVQNAVNIFEDNKMNIFLSYDVFSSDQKILVSAWKLHYLTMHWIFKLFRLDVNERAIKDLRLYEGNQERHLRNYLNSFGIEPYCNDLAPNNRSSLLMMRLLMIIDRLEFKDRGFITEFDELYAISERIHNGALLLNRLDDYKIRHPNMHPEMIAKSEGETIKSVLVRLLGWWLNGGLLNINEVKSWVNSKLSNEKIYSFRDLTIYQDYIFAKVLDVLEPGNINFNYIKCMEKSEFAQYYVSMARRCGYLIFTTPEQFIACEYDYILLAFATLMYNRKHNNILCPA